ncbi:low-complexity tail membrane protein [Nodosilinea nodulosa]|uniref:low-complexity tail membrane protein n=1 Tax=Nodosilinea nodulosa TaxID=416001 RepID=UPI0002F37751|nr:low-complexity tail membrane protein [Nodosilinea nodulosa]
MAPWRYDPYLWVHLAGLATVPLWIDLCLLGLAVGNPALPGLELGVVIVLGALPVLTMQLLRPFYIFSLPGIALRPACLSDDQRLQLSQFRRWRVRLGALLVPLPLVWVLIKLYPLAFLARDVTPFSGWGRLGGVAIAALGFFLANLFLQVPVAVLQVMATPDRRMVAVQPYPVEAIAANFSWLGLSVSWLLPSLAPHRDVGDQNLVSQAEPSPDADSDEPSLELLDPEALHAESLDLDKPTLAQAKSVLPQISIAEENPAEAVSGAGSPKTVSIEAAEAKASDVSGPDLEPNELLEIRESQEHPAEHHLLEDSMAARSAKAIRSGEIDHSEDGRLAMNHSEAHGAKGNSSFTDPISPSASEPIAVDTYP